MHHFKMLHCTFETRADAASMILFCMRTMPVNKTNNPAVFRVKVRSFSMHAPQVKNANQYTSLT